MTEHTTTIDKPIIGITVGDINGIGLEVILKTLSEKHFSQICTPVIYGAAKVVSYHKNVAKIKQFHFNAVNSIDQIKHNVINVVNCWSDNFKITLGQCTEEGGKYAYLALEKATNDLKEGEIDALVTAPIHKKAMQMAGFEYTGHTEYLTKQLEAEDSLMFMVHEDLRVGLVTNHLPISAVSAAITSALVYDKIELMHETLCMDFGINKPTIAILGLNPHAGDSGVIGSEEIDIIIPAIEKAKKKGILAIGPYPADGLFGSSNYHNFDGILAMYHDQGLAPFKAMAFGGGVNFTAGLSAVRTSPDHGTGYDIVGKNMANPSSFREALYLAIDAIKHREEYIELTANPLKKTSEKELEALEKEEKENSDRRRHNRDKKQHRAPRQDKKGTQETKQEKPAIQKEQPIQEQKEETPTPKKEMVKEQPKKEVPVVDPPLAVAISNEEKKNLSIEERLALAEQRKKMNQDLDRIAKNIETIKKELDK